MAYQTLQQLLLYRNAQLLWARRDTRWDIYPQQEPTILAVHNYEGWWLPCPDGQWFKSPVSYIEAGAAHGPALFGAWIETPLGLKCHGKDLTITDYQRGVSP